MRVKSAYRKYRDGGAVMAEDIAPAPIAVPTDAGSVGNDDASLAFKTQIDHLLRAEEASKQRTQASPQQPTRAERLNKLRQEGLSEVAVSFLGSNHDIMDYPHLADQAARIARDEGYLPDTEAFFQAVKSNFRAITTPPPPASSQALETAQKYSGSSSMPDLHDEAGVSQEVPPTRREMGRGIVSAPVSREAPSWTGKREDRPGSITLSLAQKEAARISGLTEVEYSRNLLRLREAKAADPDRYGSGQ